MTTAELAVAEQLTHLREIALKRGWPLKELDPFHFVIGMLARNDTWFWLLVDCDDFPQQPPAFNWYDPESEALNQPANTPKGGGYFHSSGCLCAPWNRLAYKQGLHNDWILANWMTNPHTRGTTTLPAMVLRIYRELRSPNYQGRMG